jgi:hypothetical protein
MKSLLSFVALLGCFTFANAYTATVQDASIETVLSDIEVSYLVFMREEEKLARDTYLTLSEKWDLMVFTNIASSEQTHMDTMLAMLNIYDVADPVVNDAVGSFTNPVLAGLYVELVADAGYSLLDALFVGALIEEIDIRDIQEAIDETAHTNLITAYENLMAGSKNHLRAFVSQIELLGVDYVAQVLTQAEVDIILRKTTPGVFEINAGLNDAWYYPETNGQGFFITVFPDLELVSLAWFTYDTERPSDDVKAILGDAGHRWLTATGPFSGSDAQLEISLTSGGIFDSTESVPVSEPGGTILLHFDGCNSGTVTYDIPSIGRNSTLPIERVAQDNVALCETIIGAVE